MSHTGTKQENSPLPTSGQLEAEILDRYAQGAQEVEPGLCCPTSGYATDLLEMLPSEIVEKDYGCGDPSVHVKEGEVVIDLGSGVGKACYILSQKVGSAGRVIGLDFNDAMLAVARKYTDDMAGKLGYGNVAFHKTRIQDMALDLDVAALWLRDNPVTTIEEAAAFDAHCESLRREQPLVRDESVDVIVSNCVLNLVRPEEKEKLFREMHRVLKRGGRAVISDIVCDEEPTDAILADATLWSGCIAGAFREDRFLERFEEAGFYGIEIVDRAEEPWQVIDGIEFRSLTVRAFKGKEGPCLERNQAVIYQGPWKQVSDDDGHRLLRGKRMAVCDKTFRLLTDPAGPYAGAVLPVSPRVAVPIDTAEPFDGLAGAERAPQDTKGVDYRETHEAESAASCTPESGCC